MIQLKAEGEGPLELSSFSETPAFWEVEVNSLEKVSSSDEVSPSPGW